MRLNPDCIRDILLVIESLPDMRHYYRFDLETIPKLFPNYSIEEVQYHIRQCDFNGFLHEVSHFQNGDYVVHDLTPKGHEFLANIRENKVWNGVKSIATKVGSSSLDSLTQIASNVITELIKTQFSIR